MIATGRTLDKAAARAPRIDVQGRRRERMPVYVVLYKFTTDGVRNIRDSVKRAGRVRQQNAAAGFMIRDVFWTQGPYDMVAIVEAPSEETMMGAMLNVVSAGNVTSTTMRAFDALEMSRILATVPSLPEESEPAVTLKRASAKKSAKKGPAKKSSARR
jgi:uncharacterized protein with GYD domain